jgi:hypothetical protein
MATITSIKVNPPLACLIVTSPSEFRRWCLESGYVIPESRDVYRMNQKVKYALAMTATESSLAPPRKDYPQSSTRLMCGQPPEFVEEGTETDAEEACRLSAVAIGGIECALDGHALHRFDLRLEVERAVR